MKKIYYFIFFLSIGAYSQVTFEQTYTNTGGTRGKTYTFYTQSGLKYYTQSSSNTNGNYSISIYNENHTFIQTIPVFGEILFITDKLFDNDDEIEIVTAKYRQVTIPDTYTTRDIFITDHLGGIIYTFFDRFAAHLVKNSNDEIKLIVDSAGNCPIGCTYSNNYMYDVYSVAGILSTNQEIYLDRQLNAYPIPTENLLTISNVVTDGSKINLEIFDTTGKKILEKIIINDSSQFDVDVSHLQSGIYICKFGNNAIKFIKK